MDLDFEREYGVNAGYVQELHQRWLSEPQEVDEAWARIFERAGGPAPATVPASSGDPAASGAPAPEADPTLAPLRGLAGKIADNMMASLEVPTATSVRTLPAKVLVDS